MKLFIDWDTPPPEFRRPRWWRWVLAAVFLIAALASTVIVLIASIVYLSTFI